MFRIKISLLKFLIVFLSLTLVTLSVKVGFARHPEPLLSNMLVDNDSAGHFQVESRYLFDDKEAKYQIYLENYQSDRLVDKPTWIVIHGFGHSPSNLEDQDLQKNLKNSGAQVLQVDWSSITKRSVFSLWSSAGFIPSVGEFVADSLIRSGLVSGKNINCIGHSFGSYVCWEVSKRIEDFDRLIALEPASEAGTSLLGRKFYDTSQVNFAEHSQYSWAFKSSDRSSKNASLTADDSFLVKYYSYPENEHNDIIGFLSTLIRRNSKGEGGHVSLILNLNNMKQNKLHPWERNESDYEGEILIQNEHHPSSIYRWIPLELHHKKGVLKE
jgi:pimeloyl-ACP methyl ester carboxylesterase